MSLPRNLMKLLLPVSYYGPVVPLQATVQYLLWLPRSLFRGFQEPQQRHSVGTVKIQIL